jgi:hypothetical protein
VWWRARFLFEPENRYWAAVRPAMKARPSVRARSCSPTRATRPTSRFGARGQTWSVREPEAVPGGSGLGTIY